MQSIRELPRMHAKNALSEYVLKENLMDVQCVSSLNPHYIGHKRDGLASLLLVLNDTNKGVHVELL